MLPTDTVLQNRYLIVRKLGQGGMGAIYEAVDQRVSCLVALKQTLVSATVGSQDAFYREAALLANLRHPSLPKVMDYFTEDGGEFLVMEFIGGEDLLQMLMRHDGPMPQMQVLHWAIQLLNLLEYLHTHEPPILHRDIKPANLKVTKEGDLFLLDFGLAKGTSGQMVTMETDRSVPGYTPVYSSLEQILGQGTDPRSDLYSVGATLFHLLTGQPPISAPARFNAIENGQPDPLKSANQLNVRVAPEVAACIQNAMALSRKNRTATAREMRQTLQRAVQVISEREVVRKVEQTLLDDSPEPDPSRPLIKDDGVQFTVYTPEKIKPQKNYTVLAFAHLSKRRDDAAPDEPDPLEEVRKQAERLLGEQRRDYVDTKDSSKQSVPRGGELTFVPVVRGLTFSPPSRSFMWRKSVHREEFDVFASKEVDGSTLDGRMTVFLGSVVIAEVPLSISVDSHVQPGSERISLDQARSSRRVRHVFASYSPRDEQVVAELAQVAPIFGSRFLLDRTHLEPGEDRAEGLQRLIRDADVFQLFWSTNSMRSAEIASEIRYAVGLNRTGFILPTYWEEPVPRSPEEGLPPPEIDRLQFYRIYPAAISNAAADSVAESRLVVSGPPGSEIYLDDERYASIGTSGRVILRSIATGKHRLRITNAAGRDDERIIEVGPDTAEQVITANLKQNATYERASSAPYAADTGALETAAVPQQDTITAASPSLGAELPSRSRSSSLDVHVGFRKVCISCRIRYSTDVKFCHSCGSPVVDEMEQTSPPPAYAPTMQSMPMQSIPAPVQTKRKMGFMVPLFAGTAMVLFLFVAAPVWYMWNKNNAPHPTATNPNSNPTLEASEPASDLSLVDLNGKKFSVKNFRGHVVVLNVWATSSADSRQQIPVLNDLQQSFGGSGLTVIGVSFDDTSEQVKQFQREVPIHYQVGLGAKVSKSDLLTTYVIDRSGTVIKKLVGVQSKSTLISEIRPPLNEKD